jgi:hypothetical protein
MCLRQKQRLTMQKQKSYNLDLFDDEPYEPVDETLSIDKASFAAALERLKSADSITTLRREVIALKEQLCDIASPVRANSTGGDSVDFSSLYLNEELNQIGRSHTLERAFYYVDRLVKSICEVRVSEINDLNLNRWKEITDVYVDSLWVIDKRENSGVHSAGYWGNFIPQIPYQMMRRYTKKGDWVIDAFAGSGTTLIEAQRLGRNTVGIELRADLVDNVKRLVASEPNTYAVVSDIVQGDTTVVDYRSLLQSHGRDSAQMVIMHPPYFDIIKFSDDPHDLSNADSVDSFLAMMGKAVDNVAPVLDTGRRLALVIGDKYAKGDWIPLGFLTMAEILKRGFALKSIVVKNFEETTGKRQQKELWKYRALAGGFYIFKHEYIFVFKKQ